MAVLHRIKAYLYDNYLTKDDPNDYIARTVSERTFNVKQVCEAAVMRGGADISATSMEHATELFFKEMAYQLCDGYSVNTGWFIASTTIRGIFENINEKFNKAKHSILFLFNQGDKLRAEIPNIEVNILGLADSSASIVQVTDMKSGSVNDLLTPGRNLKIAGTKIKIAGDDESNGIYFTDPESEDRIPVDPSDIVINNPSEVMIVIPELVSGQYVLEIVTQYSGGTLLIAPRSTVFEKFLTVE